MSRSWLWGDRLDRALWAEVRGPHSIGNMAANQSVTAITSLDRHCTHAKADGVLGDPPPSNDLCQEGPLGIGACSLAPFSQGEPGPMSPDRRGASPPACFEHRLPRLDGVVPEHPSTCHRFRWPGWHPSIGAHRDPLRMSGRCVGLELNDLLLIKIRQPSLTFGFLRRGIGGEVLAGHGVESGSGDRTATRRVRFC